MSRTEIGPNESFEAALRRFTRQVQADGILTEAKRRESFENAAEKKKRKRAALKARRRRE